MTLGEFPDAVARWLVRQRHVSVIPIDHPASTRESDPQRIGKVPRLATWKQFQVALPTDDNLRVWFPDGEPRNLGIVTGTLSQLVAIDGDNAAALAWMHAHLPATPMRTRSAKGEHWYFRHPGVPVHNKVRLRTDDPAIEIDVRGDGGYCIAPPSLHASGAKYERLGTWPAVEDLPTLDPKWIAASPPTAVELSLVAMTVPMERLVRRARAYVDNVPPAIQGQGGDIHTFQLACKLRRGFGLSETDAFELLRTWNRSCVPAWTDRELEEKIRSAGKYGTEPLGGRI
jgi:Bifunctional DNA primase/polymerase, N-terminal